VRFSELPYVVPIVEHGFQDLNVGVRHSGHGFEEVQEAIEAELLKRRLAVIDIAAQRFAAEVGRQSGLAAEGLGPVHA
jgi:peptide chain release factor subunit 1